MARDFVHCDTVLLTRLSCFAIVEHATLLTRLSCFAIVEHATRRIHILSVTTHPTADWVTPQARTLLRDLGDHVAQFTFLIHDRDSKFTCVFDAVFTSEGIQILKTPLRAPRANAIMERWIGHLRRELLDRMPILNTRQLRQVLTEYEHHFTTHRPHRSPVKLPRYEHSPSPTPPTPRSFEST